MIDVNEILHASVKNRGFVTAKHLTHSKTYKKRRNSFTMFFPSWIVTKTNFNSEFTVFSL